LEVLIIQFYWVDMWEAFRLGTQIQVAIAWPRNEGQGKTKVMLCKVDFSIDKRTASGQSGH